MTQWSSGEVRRRRGEVEGKVQSNSEDENTRQHILFHRTTTLVPDADIE